MTAELRSIYSGPIRRGLEQLTGRVAALENALTTMSARIETLQARVTELEASDGS